MSVRLSGGPSFSSEPLDVSFEGAAVRFLALRFHDVPRSPSLAVSEYAELIFTFLDYGDVAFENNFAERQIRPAVILRKNPDASGSNRSDRGAATQAILMSVYRTLKLRGLNPTKTITDALRTYLNTGQLPPPPDTHIPDG